MDDFVNDLFGRSLMLPEDLSDPNALEWDQIERPAGGNMSRGYESIVVNPAAIQSSGVSNQTVPAAPVASTSNVATAHENGSNNPAVLYNFDFHNNPYFRRPSHGSSGTPNFSIATDPTETETARTGHNTGTQSVADFIEEFTTLGDDADKENDEQDEEILEEPIHWGENFVDPNDRSWGYAWGWQGS